MKALKKYGLDLGAIIVFILISVAYFAPADFDGRILYQHDASAGVGLGREAEQFNEQTGETTRWTNSAFGGMPTYQTAPSYNSTTLLGKVMDIYHLCLPDYVWYLFVYLLGFYILLRAFGLKQPLSVLGAVGWAFSSYLLIIIGAGHIWKVWALAYLPPLIAGVVLAYRGKYLWGFILTAIFSAFEVKANHVQMTYYFLFVIAFMVIAYLVQAIREKKLAAFGKATLVCIAGAAIGICINLSSLYHTWQYGQESMRGKSELTQKQKTSEGDQVDASTGGLSREYITQWSYGIGETWTLLIPNAKGGAHNIQLGSDEKAMEKCDPQYAQYVGQWYQYWGDQPFTAGPVYVGAFLLLLFIMGLFLVKGPMKWALLAATVLSIMLSWGKNFMPLTDFFIDYMPLYSKFRTVSSILVIAEFTIPLLALLTLKKIVDEPDVLKQNMKYLWISFGLTAGFCLIFALAPGMFFDFTSANDEAQLARYIPQEVLPAFMSSMAAVREAVFTADCWRSFWIIVVGTALLLLYRYRKMNGLALAVTLFVLCIVDLWQVDKRYLHDSMFVDAQVKEQPQQKTPIDEYILQDKTLDYRVLNMAGDTFNENNTSYYHKSIGGYHAAKLRRYNELINHYISPEMQALAKALPSAQLDLNRLPGDSIMPVLNMLNTKYIIVPVQEQRAIPLVNHQAMGNAWIVDKIDYVSTADDELAQLGKIDLRREAVADKKFEQQLGQSTTQTGQAVVTMTSYKPNHLTYDVNTEKGGVVVFSEIYYPEWTATIDGQPAELGRVNYVLRALQVKPGQHKVELDFHPASIKKTESVAYVSYAVLILAIAAGAFVAVRRKKNGVQD